MARMHDPFGRRRLGLAAVLLALALPLAAAGQAPDQTPAPHPADQILKAETYQSPPQSLADAVLAPRYLNVSLGEPTRDKKWFVDEIGDGPVPMRTFSKPFHELGGVFIDFKANRARSLTIRNNVGIQIISAADGARTPVQVPPGARVSNATWSPDGSVVAFFVHGDDATHIWVANAADGRSRQLTRTPVLATLVTSFQFTEDGKALATVLVPDGRPPMPQPPAAPPGPTVKIADAGKKNRLRTFASLMSTPYEQALLEWHATGQLALIDVASGAVKTIGKPDMIRSLDPSNDGAYVRVTRMVKPFSYDVPVNNFGTIEEIWDATGTALATVTERPLDLGVQDDTAPDPGAGFGRGGQQTGKREVAWRADGRGLSYLEQEPAPEGDDADAPAARAGRGAGRGGAGRAGGQRGARPQRKDRLYQWTPPFDDASRTVLYENDARMNGLRYSPDMQVLFFSEREGQNVAEFAVYLSDPAQRYALARYESNDLDANPGALVSTRGTAPSGRGGGFGRGGGGGSGPVLLSADGASVFYQGTTYDTNPNEVGPRTFIDKVAIKTGDKARLYESSNDGVFERVTTVLDPEAGRYIVSRESPTEVAQNYLVEGERRTALTRNEDYTPDITNARVERFSVERVDGFRFSVKVTLPQDYRDGERLPALFWFYPREYTDQEAYDRPDRTFNKNAFPNFGVRSMQYFVRLGYAVVEPDSPIVGPEGQMNNNYVNDLRNNLSAVIDELDRRGIADRTKLAIGGHSYGAFSTVNAMVHTPFFKAGIAGDGNYNRSLTPIGFQSERRDLWEAPNVYLSMSPFFHANNLNGALLMYHGQADQNVGTDPDNSIRLYHALNGLGKTTALYMYPLEDHGPAAKETLLDLWARWAAWLDKYVKHPVKAGPEITSGGKH